MSDSCRGTHAAKRNLVGAIKNKSGKVVYEDNCHNHIRTTWFGGGKTEKAKMEILVMLLHAALKRLSQHSKPFHS